MRSKKVLVKQRGNLLDLHHFNIEFLKKQLLKYKLIKDKNSK